MITITPQMKILIYSESVNFRNGIDGLARLCRDLFSEDPFSGKVFIFRNRKSTSVKILVYDGQGYWCCQKRLSDGKFNHWPKKQSDANEFSSRELSVLLFNGDPFSSRIAHEWKKVS